MGPDNGSTSGAVNPTGNSQQPTPQYDFTKFGADGATVREMMQDPQKVHHLLGEKRGANGEARTYREQLEKMSKFFGKDVQTVEKMLTLQNQLATNTVKYNQLDSKEREIANELVKSGHLKPGEIGMSDNEFKALSAKKDDSKRADNSGNSELEKLRAENEALKKAQQEGQYHKELYDYFLSQGANPQSVNDLIKLWSEPEIPEGTSQEDEQKLREEHAQKFIENRAWAFQKPEMANVHNQRIIKPSPNATELDQARANGDVLEMMRIKRMTTQNNHSKLPGVQSR